MARSGAAYHGLSVNLRPSGAALFWCFLTPLGCYHTIEPIKPLLLPIEVAEGLFPRGALLRLENGYFEPEMRWIRTEGLHKLEVDLREWTARLLSELEIELERRQVFVVLAEEALSGTSVNPIQRPEPRRKKDGPFPILRAWVSDLKAPDPEADRGPYLSADLESEDGDFSASYAVTTKVKGFGEAFQELKKSILEDPRFQSWLKKRQEDIGQN